MKTTPDRKVVASVFALGAYALMVNINLKHRSELLQAHRRLSLDLGNGDCALAPPFYKEKPANSDATLLASYPGSGKRFAWTIIEALTNHSSGDDWDFSGNGMNVLHLKTVWPHKEGVYSWGDKMENVLLLLRSPRWALPSYHTMRWELDFSQNWQESYLRIPFVYTGRSPVALWEAWRDENFETEIQAWVDYADFWMSGGTFSDGSVSEHCNNGDMNCDPKGVLDFDNLFNDQPGVDFLQIGAVLDASENVPVIAAEARACIVANVYSNPALHNSNRNGNGPVRVTKVFTCPQLQTIQEKLEGLRDKYTPNTDALTLQFTTIINEFISDVAAEIVLFCQESPVGYFDIGTCDTFTLLTGAAATCPCDVNIGLYGYDTLAGTSGFIGTANQASSYAIDTCRSEADAIYAATLADTSNCVTMPAMVPGLVVTPGYYCQAAAITIAAATTITLDAGGDVNAEFVFVSAGAITTGDSVRFVLAGGATFENIFWITTGAATLGANSISQGIFITGPSAALTIAANAKLCGRALIDAAATMGAGSSIIAADCVF